MDLGQKAVDLTGKVMATGIPQKIGSGVSAVQKSLEGDTQDLRFLFTDPDTGRASFPVAAEAAIQTAATEPAVQSHLDKFLESNYGHLLPVLADNPGISMALSKIPYAKTVMNTAMDRLTKKRFEGIRAQALRSAGSMSDELASRYEDLSNRYSSSDILSNVINRRLKYTPHSGMDTSEMVVQANRMLRQREGRSMTDKEKAYLRQAVEEVRKKSYDTKGLAAVYEKTPGGISGQRFRTALQESERLRGTAGAKLQDTGGALEQARGKVQEIMNMKGPAKRVKGTYVNLGKLKENWKNKDAKSASYSEIAAMFGNLCDKLAGDSTATNLVDTLSSTHFNQRQVTKPKVLNRKDFSEDGGVNGYVNSKIYSRGESDKAKSKLLQNIFKKLKKELYFKDDITYTDSV